MGLAPDELSGHVNPRTCSPDRPDVLCLVESERCAISAVAPGLLPLSEGPIRPQEESHGDDEPLQSTPVSGLRAATCSLLHPGSVAG